VSGTVSLQRTKTGGVKDGDPPAGRVPFIATKIVPPAARAGRIPRSRLEDLLGEASECKLTILRAPGGFGKTTLALAWIEQLRTRGDQVAWLSIDDDDNEPRRFAYYAISALHRACEHIGAESLKVAGAAPLPQLQALLINEIADSGDELFFFLDDYNAISSEPIHEFVSFLLRHAPANLRLVILSRSQPPLELGSLRARGELLEIDAARLRFTREETGEFLGVTSPASLGPAEIRTIHGLTEGWPAALRITALSFGAGRDPAELLRSLARSPRSIGGFLDELCASLPADLLDFLQRTSIVERLNAPLCQAITGRQDSAELLGRLERQQLISPLDIASGLFTCHQLFREYLLQRLAQQSGPELPALRRRASCWFESEGLELESIKQLLAAGDTNAALSRISRNADRMVQAGDLLTLLNLQQQLRSKFIQQPVSLQLAIIWAEALSLSSTEALQHIAAVERAVASADTPEAAMARAECLALKAVAAAIADDVAGATQIVAQYDSQPGGRALARDSIYNVARFASIANAAWQDFYAVPRVSREDDSDILTATYEANLYGIAEMAQANAHAAEGHLVQCAELGSRVRRFTGATVMARGSHAELLYETGRIDEAEALLREDIDLIAGGVILDTVLRGLWTAARLAWRKGQGDQAANLLERAEAIGLTRDWPRLVAGALFERLRLQQQQGLTMPALGLLKRLQQLHASDAGSTTRGIAGVAHYHGMAQALIELDQNRSRQAVGALTPLFRDAVDCGAGLLAIRVGSLLARALVQARAVPQALRVFNQVLDLAEPSGLVGSIADSGPEILQLIDLLQGNGGGPERETRSKLLKTLRDSAISVWGRQAAPASPARTELPSPLSPRECEILEFIAEGASNKEVARTLGLAPETVKTHLKNIFLKLEVERRTQAVLRAEELGLLRVRRGFR
jgi:LuxR family maltose regulon positive regulatory protein